MIVLIVLSVMLSKTARDKRKFEALFTYDVDFLFFEMAKTIQESKGDIYDYENTLKILYHDKKTIFTKPVLSYSEQFPKLWENVVYLEKLLQKEIFSHSFKKRIDQNHKTLLKIAKIKHFTHTILTFWTL